MTTFELFAAWASIGGFFLSLGALWKASTAAAAAQAVRRSIGNRLTSDELELTCIRAEQLLDFLDHDRAPEAMLRAIELASGLAELSARRSPSLSPIQLNSLLTIREQSASISTALRKGRRTGGTLDKTQLAFVAESIAVALRGILGDVKARIDSETSNDK